MPYGYDEQYSYDDPWGGNSGSPSPEPTAPAVEPFSGGDTTRPLDPISAWQGTTPAAPQTPAAQPRQPAQRTGYAYQAQLQRLQGLTDPSQQAIARDELARSVFNDLKAAGHDVKWQGDQLMVDGRPYVVGGGGGSSSASSSRGGGGSSLDLDWSPQGPVYKPGEITDDDIPTLTYEQMLRDASAMSPIEESAERLIGGILADPWGGLDDRYVDTLKARSKDELADAYMADDEEIKNYAGDLGIGSDSPWASAERLKARQGYRLGLAGVNRETDLKVNDMRNTRTRDAASLGASYAGQKAQRRQAAMSLASDTAFRRAAAVGDRMALRESVKQAAAQLGLSRDALMSGFIVEKANVQLRERGLILDEDRLAQADAHFKEELLFRLAQLDESARQFDNTFNASGDDANRDDVASLLDG